MDEKETIKKVIDEFFDNASAEELLEIQTLLQKKKSEKHFIGKMDINGIANKFSSELKERMGLTSEQITQTARNAVRTMILQYDQKISEKQIQVLLDKWVPDRNAKREKISTEVMRTMLAQFVAYGRGELNEDHLKSFPDGWANKYWNHFPEEIQRLVDAYIKDRINRNQFWEAVDNFLK